MTRLYFYVCTLFLCVFNLISFTNGLSLPREGRTCVIGAGISGLATARYLQEYGVTNFTVFEASRHIGGTWRFDPHVGVDADGLPVMTYQYKYLRTNTPRQTMEFGGFPFPEDAPSYPMGDCYYKYLKLFTKQFGLYKYIQFQSYITSVRREHYKWILDYTSTATRTNETEYCDTLVMAIGQYGKIRMPNFMGMDEYKGNIIHSRDYKEPEPYTGRRVLVVGAGASGLDIATQLSPIAAKLVHSHHLKYNEPEFPGNYVRKPDIHKFTPTGAVFVDGSEEDFEDVILCTGYEFNLDFLDRSVGLTATEKFVLPLYNHVVNIKFPSMMIVGISKSTSTRLLDAQAEYAAALIAGRFELPTQDRMLKSWISHVYYLHSLGKKIQHVNVVGDLQDQYFANLTSEANIRRVPPVVTKLRDYNLKIRLDDLLNYREYDFQVFDNDTFKRMPSPGRKDVCPIAEV